MNTKENKLNNGYVLFVFFHFVDQDGRMQSYTRQFGPFKNPIVAIDQFKALTKLKPQIPKEHYRNDMLRPVLGFRYKVEFSKKGIVAIAIKTLELQPSLENLKNPKD
jgi:hypothetical protein